MKQFGPPPFLRQLPLFLGNFFMTPLLFQILKTRNPPLILGGTIVIAFNMNPRITEVTLDCLIIISYIIFTNLQGNLIAELIIYVGTAVSCLSVSLSSKGLFAVLFIIVVTNYLVSQRFTFLKNKKKIQ